MLTMQPPDESRPVPRSRTLRLSRAWKRERSGRWKASAAGGGSAGAPSDHQGQEGPPTDATALLVLPGTPATLLRTCSPRPYWITSSAWNRATGRLMVRPRALAVLRLMTHLECGSLLHGQIGRLGALEDLVHVCGGEPKPFSETRLSPPLARLRPGGPGGSSGK